MTSEGQLNTTLPIMNDMRNQTYTFVDLMPFTYYEFSVAAFAETAIQIHYGIPSDPPVVARTDEDSKILSSCVIYNSMFYIYTLEVMLTHTFVSSLIPLKLNEYS